MSPTENPVTLSTGLTTVDHGELRQATVNHG